MIDARSQFLFAAGIHASSREAKIMTKRLCSIDPGYVQIAEIDVTDETAPFVMSTGLRLNASFPSVRVKARYAETLSYACDLCEMSALFSMPKTCSVHPANTIPSAILPPWKATWR
ncbi:hypothetical protein ICN84_10875 [Akkermansia glycaniphila]|uniref:hypothetical protein n=1 Tax=Akkermansia glycaniphila TaxID=1679444 RepID=UPI001C0124F8|nr:hypothetical protein [Akkermansia glycaniphila]MBT9450570.1 hypothetical protein [Akkermansia glycaniphila]